MSPELSEGLIVGLGNPLLDVIAYVNDELLQKYEMKPNDAILASEKHKHLCKDMAENFKVQYVAGGAIQNSMRVAQWFFSKPRVCSFFGGVNKDEFGMQMEEKAKEDCVNVAYMYDREIPTGTCACLLTNHGMNRSLCAYLGASQKFHVDHLHTNIELLNRAKIFYTSGFHLNVSIESALLLSEIAHRSSDKLFTLNLSAPYISQRFSHLLFQVLPYTDILFGNETEAKAFADVIGWKLNNLEEITQKLADYEHKRPRMVVITQGKDDVLVAVTGAIAPLRRFPVPPVPEDAIVDTTGAGDAFTGGFLAYKLLNKPLEQCVAAANYAASEIIKVSGCTLPKVNKLRLM